MRIAQVTAVIAAAGLLTAAPAAGAQPACGALGGTVDADRVCRVHAESPNYTLDFAFPTDYPDQQPLTDYLTQTRDGFVNVSDMPNARDLPYVLDAKGTAYRSGTGTGGTRSLVLEVYQNVGGLHPQTWYKAFNYDLAKGAPITFDTLFDAEADPMAVIFPVVQRELRRQTGIDQPIPAGQGMDPSHYQNFAITDDEVIFFFGQGELLPESAGAARAAVPRAELAEVLAR
ncbi:esterase [uncultured Mycolicibacterium sp.]|uniref:esterase n=1 Tax=uncultured Mycolicibacterium sp. TaxID=2320817 RepID=UPI0026217F4A|nr:esterase [uncultured Mycolicibacterium sp.]